MFDIHGQAQLIFFLMKLRLNSNNFALFYGFQSLFRCVEARLNVDCSPKKGICVEWSTRAISIHTHMVVRMVNTCEAFVTMEVP